MAGSSKVSETSVGTASSSNGGLTGRVELPEGARVLPLRKTDEALPPGIVYKDGGYYKADAPALKDSGERTEFASGAVRDRQKGKGMPHLVPNWVIWLVSRIYEDGSYKYASRNWEKGMPLSNYLDSAERHLAKLKAGMRDEPHASQVAWNIIGYIFTGWLIKIGKRPKELNDMPDQLSESGSVAEPLSPYEYDALGSFFGMEK